MNESDRRLRLNLAATVLQRFTTEPGGLTSMRKLMLDTRRGPSSPSLEPNTRGHRHDLAHDSLGVFRAKVPSDPTGEAAINADHAEEAMDELDEVLDELHACVLDLARLADEWSPVRHPKADRRDGFYDLWCRSCHRVDQHCTPVTMRPSGRPYHTGMCRWCGDLRRDLGLKVGALPPRALVERHLTGEGVPQSLLRLHSVPTSKRKRKGRKAKKAA